ncbi:MAG: hypothetical protein HW416_801 [Chloroflexi bacterium]|nr:hypothetical protein [Chloroflexota bacterium]
MDPVPRDDIAESVGMRPSVVKKPWDVEARTGSDLQDIVEDWMTQQKSMEWIPSAMVLGILLAAIVLFAAMNSG